MKSLGIAPCLLFPQISKAPGKLLASLEMLYIYFWSFFYRLFRGLSQWLHELDARKVTALCSLTSNVFSISSDNEYRQSFIITLTILVTCQR